MVRLKINNGECLPDGGHTPSGSGYELHHVVPGKTGIRSGRQLSGTDTVSPDFMINFTPRRHQTVKRLTGLNSRSRNVLLLQVIQQPAQRLAGIPQMLADQ